MPLTFNQLLGILNRTLTRLPDQRTGQNSQYSLQDAALSAFAVFFTQSPSFLAYQREMQARQGRNNAAGLFGVERIPSDAQIRNLLDPLSAGEWRAPFWDLLAHLVHRGVLAEHDYALSGLGAPRWLCALDGTQYFHSTEIHCPNCSVSLRDGVAHYAHSVLIPALVRPGRAEVLVLEPEFILPQDGAEKQDCERNAARRWIERNAEALAGHHTTILADDLHCTQPFCDLLVSQHLDFILTCKPDSHPTLYAEVERLRHVPGGMTQLEERAWTGRVHERWVYRYVHQVPLCAQPHALAVTWCELTRTVEETGAVLYHNAFATNLSVTDRTIRPLVAAGRARWKIENEHHNVLKHQGYHLKVVFRPLGTQLRAWPAALVHRAGAAHPVGLSHSHRVATVRSGLSATASPPRDAQNLL
ncbi:MAG: ISNCY family transposase [Chloroflexi bacterium]|nr:ISNCY family transposase [Chloroflexota bacterium]